MTQPITRRTVLSIGITASVAGLTGCLGAASRVDERPTLATEPEYNGWLNDANNYIGTVNLRNQDEVTVSVGVPIDFDPRAFGPAAVAVSPGTTVVWEWTGWGKHNVVSESGDHYESELVVAEGATFEHVFDVPGVHTYYCAPHRANGMKGAVFVVPSQQQPFTRVRGSTHRRCES